MKGGSNLEGWLFIFWGSYHCGCFSHDLPCFVGDASVPCLCHSWKQIAVVGHVVTELPQVDYDDEVSVSISYIMLCVYIYIYRQVAYSIYVGHAQGS